MSTEIANIRTGNRIAPIIPTTMDDVYRFAKLVAMSGLAPRGMGTPEQVSIAIFHGLELGMPPMQAIQNIAVINGRPAVWGRAIPALLLRAGFKIKETSTDTSATCEITRPDGQVFSYTFTEQDARKAGLWGKAGPWQQYPRRMLQMRARGFCAADAAPDVTSGLYMGEEMEDVPPPRDITPPPVQLEAPPEELPPEEPEAIADPGGFVEHYRDEIALMPPAERTDYAEMQADTIARLPDKHRAEIAAINEELGL